MEKKLFIGIKILPSEKLIGIYHKLRLNLGNEQIKWVSFQNMHITLKFLGNTPEYMISVINNTIEEVTDQYQPFNFEIKNLGYFTKSKKIKVIWMGIENGVELNAFAHKLIKKMSLIGFEDEKREYTAHLTLGRVNFISNQNQVDDLFSDYHEILIQNVEVKEIALFESITKSDSPYYHVIKTFSLIK